MWTYEQATGILRNPNGGVAGSGYSGAGAGKNNPELENIVDVGPIPTGLYTIGEMYDATNEGHGPDALPLTPDTENQMYGRSGFLMHGDSIAHPGSASEGCIIQALAVRIVVNSSSDKRLCVISGLTSNQDPETGL